MFFFGRKMGGKKCISTLFWKSKRSMSFLPSFLALHKLPSVEPPATATKSVDIKISFNMAWLPFVAVLELYYTNK